MQREFILSAINNNDDQLGVSLLKNFSRNNGFPFDIAGSVTFVSPLAIRLLENPARIPSVSASDHHLLCHVATAFNIQFRHVIQVSTKNHELSTTEYRRLATNTATVCSMVSGVRLPSSSELSAMSRTLQATESRSLLWLMEIAQRLAFTLALPFNTQKNLSCNPDSVADAMKMIEDAIVATNMKHLISNAATSWISFITTDSSIAQSRKLSILGSQLALEILVYHLVLCYCTESSISEKDEAHRLFQDHLPRIATALVDKTSSIEVMRGVMSRIDWLAALDFAGRIALGEVLVKCWRDVVIVLGHDVPDKLKSSVAEMNSLAPWMQRNEQHLSEYTRNCFVEAATHTIRMERNVTEGLHLASLTESVALLANHDQIQIAFSELITTKSADLVAMEWRKWTLLRLLDLVQQCPRLSSAPDAPRVITTRLLLRACVEFVPKADQSTLANIQSRVFIAAIDNDTLVDETLRTAILRRLFAENRRHDPESLLLLMAAVIDIPTNDPVRLSSASWILQRLADMDMKTLVNSELKPGKFLIIILRAMSAVVATPNFSSRLLRPLTSALDVVAQQVMERKGEHTVLCLRNSMKSSCSTADVSDMLQPMIPPLLNNIRSSLQNLAPHYRHVKDVRAAAEGIVGLLLPLLSSVRLSLRSLESERSSGTAQDLVASTLMSLLYIGCEMSRSPPPRINLALIHKPITESIQVCQRLLTASGWACISLSQLEKLVFTLHSACSMVARACDISNSKMSSRDADSAKRSLRNLVIYVDFTLQVKEKCFLTAHRLTSPFGMHQGETSGHSVRHMEIRQNFCAVDCALLSLLDHQRSVRYLSSSNILVSKPLGRRITDEMRRDFVAVVVEHSHGHASSIAGDELSRLNDADRQRSRSNKVTATLRAIELSPHMGFSIKERADLIESLLRFDEGTEHDGTKLSRAQQQWLDDIMGKGEIMFI